MQLNRSTMLTVVMTLMVGVAIGALFLGGSSAPAAPEGHEDHEHELSETGLWTCSMHPQVRESEPGSCPFCGMDLIPVGSEDNGDPAVLKMSGAAVELANIQTTVIGERDLSGSILLNGKIRADERRVNTQTTHFAGRIERLYKNFEGDRVRKGDKVASIYSPALVAAQEELIEAKKLETSNPVLLEAARKKLRYWKLSDRQIEQIESSKEPMRNFDLLADFEGVITKRMVNSGDHLHEGEVLLEITDLSRVWVVFEVYEKDLESVRVGNAIEFTATASSQRFNTEISFISPEVDPQTRIVEVRADIQNGNGALKPDMLIRGQLNTSATRGLMVPKSAVLWTGKRSVVYTKTGTGQQFQANEVVLGARSGDYYLVKEGLNAGDEVVTNGAFTIDAEAQLQGKNSMMNQIITRDKPEAVPFEEVELPEFKDYQNQVDPGFRDQLMNLSVEYIDLKDLMVEGNSTDIRKSGVRVRRVLGEVDMTLTKGDAHSHWMTLLKPMQESLDIINSSGDRDAQRLQFINLSKALINAVRSFGTSFDSPLYIQFCPMANNDEGALWISLEEEIINPYFGDVMLHCGNVEDVIVN